MEEYGRYCCVCLLPIQFSLQQQTWTWMTDSTAVNKDIFITPVYVSTGVHLLLGWFVYLSLGLHKKTLTVRVGHGPSKNPLNFGMDPGRSRIFFFSFFIISTHWCNAKGYFSINDAMLSARLRHVMCRWDANGILMLSSGHQQLRSLRRVTDYCRNQIRIWDSTEDKVLSPNFQNWSSLFWEKQTNMR